MYRYLILNALLNFGVISSTGANLRKTVKRTATPQEQIEARRKSLRSATKEPIEESIEPVNKAVFIEALEPQKTTRTILKAKRRLGKQTKVMPSVVPEIPRRVSCYVVSLIIP